jgi:glucan phosphoethanolaminetransferase (alkaline phosphatase superfamily)
VSALFLLLFLIPAAVLCWRIVVTKTRTHWLRVGAAAAVMITVVGALVVYDDLYNFDFADWRDDLALAAASAGSFYLLGWAQRHRSNKRHRTISIIGAIVGLVPVIATIATVLIFGESA